MSGECDKCGEHALECKCELQAYIQALKDIYRHLDNLEYECASRIYTLDDDQISWVFYCRDHAWETLKKFKRI